MHLCSICHQLPNVGFLKKYLISCLHTVAGACSTFCVFNDLIRVPTSVYRLPASPPSPLPTPRGSKCGSLISVCSRWPPHRRGILRVRGKGNVPLPVPSTALSGNRTCHQQLKLPTPTTPPSLWISVLALSRSAFATASCCKPRDC